MQKWIPRVIALLVALAGIMSLISALLPGAYDRLLILREFVPLSIRSGSRIVTLLAGFGLIVLAQNLLARKRRAWALSLVLLLISFMAHLAKGLDFEESLLTLVPVALLLRYQFIFSVGSTRLQPGQILKRIFLIVVTLTLYAIIGYTLLQTQFAGAPRPSAIELDYVNATTGLGQDVLRANSRWARWFEDSLGLMSAAAGFGVILALFAPVLDHETPSEADREKVRSLSIQGENSTAYFASMPDKMYFWSMRGGQVVSYAVARATAVALGEPIGLGGGEDTLNEFVSAMETRGLKVVFFNVTESFALRASRAGCKKIKLGEDAVIPTEAFSLEGASIADVRHAVTKMQREGYSYAWYEAATIPWAVLRELDTMHAGWVVQKHAPPLTFSLEYYPLPVTHEVKILTIQNKEKKLVGALSFLPYKEGRGMVLDLMLRSDEAKNGMMEAAIVEAITYFRSHGIDDLNLGMAPLANSNKTLVTLFNNFNKLYQFKSLYKFKAKFNPRWEPKYMLINNQLDFPQVAAAIVAVHLKKSLWSYIWEK